MNRTEFYVIFAVCLVCSSIPHHAWSLERRNTPAPSRTTLNNTILSAAPTVVKISEKNFDCQGLDNKACDAKLQFALQWSVPGAAKIEVWMFYGKTLSGTSPDPNGLSLAENKVIQPVLDTFVNTAYTSEVFCKKIYPQCHTGLPAKLNRFTFGNNIGSAVFGMTTHHGQLPIMVVAYGQQFPKNPADYTTYPLAINVNWAPLPQVQQAAPVKPDPLVAVMPADTCPPVAPLTLPDMSYQKIRTFLETHPLIDSVDGFLKCLPEGMFDLYAAVRSSSSPEAPDIDPAHPRIILLSPDGTLTFSFTGLPDGKDYDVIRLLEFSTQEKRFHLYKLAFPAANKPASEISPVQFEENPQQCAACHSSSNTTADTKPIWNPYRDWHNAYGFHSDEDWVNMNGNGTVNFGDYSVSVSDYGDGAQYDQFKQFLLDKASRYTRVISHILQAGGLTEDLLKSTSNTVPRPPLNRDIGTLWASLNGKRIAARLAGSPVFLQYRYRLAGVLLGCSMPANWPQQFQPTTAALPDVQGFYEKYLALQDAAAIATQLKKNNYPTDSQSLKYEFEDRRRYAVIGLLSGLLGITYDDWDMAVFPNTTGVGGGTKSPGVYESAAWFKRGPAFNFGIQEQDFFVYQALVPFYTDVPEVHTALDNLFSDVVYTTKPYAKTLSRMWRVYQGGPVAFTTQCNILAPYLQQELQL